MKRAKGDVFVITGPLFDGAMERLGPASVLVPTGFFKMVDDPGAGKCWMHVHRNSSEERVSAPRPCGEFTQ